MHIKFDISVLNNVIFFIISFNLLQNKIVPSRSPLTKTKLL